MLEVALVWFQDSELQRLSSGSIITFLVALDLALG